MSEYEKGTVKFYKKDEDFGFIKRKENDNVHFDASSLKSGSDTPEEGDFVNFRIEHREEGPHAVDLEVTKDKAQGSLQGFLKDSVINFTEVDYDKFCEKVKKYAYKLKGEEVSTSQIRNVYSRIMNADDIEDIKLLRPHFAYTAGRNTETKILMDLLDELAQELESEKHLENFKKFMEAVVAYRKYAGDDK